MFPGNPRCASPPFADTEVVTSRSVLIERPGDGDGPRTVVDEASVRTSNFAPDGSQGPAQTQVGTAVERFLLARRKSAVPRSDTTPIERGTIPNGTEPRTAVMLGPSGEAGG